MKLIIVSGLSGSGKSIALNTLEDIGYYCIDSLPLFLMKNFVEALSGRGDSRFARMAIGVDSRYRAGELDEFESLLAGLEQQGISSQTLFLEADDETLIKRYSETRRRHPLSDNQRPLAEAIHLERDTLAPLLDKADLRIDTSHTNQHQLRDLIKFRIDKDSPSQVSLLFESFGFKRGVPRDADFVYDARCLPNPYWEKSLRSLSGKNPAVAAFLESHQDVLSYKQDIIKFLERWIPCFAADGRSYLTVAIGCTGGQHRSVYLAEQLSSHFGNGTISVLTRHRELT